MGTGRLECLTIDSNKGATCCSQTLSTALMIAYMYYMYVCRVAIPRPHLHRLCLAFTPQRKSTSGVTISLAVCLAL